MPDKYFLFSVDVLQFLPTTRELPKSTSALLILIIALYFERTFGSIICLPVFMQSLMSSDPTVFPVTTVVRAFSFVLLA